MTSQEMRQIQNEKIPMLKNYFLVTWRSLMKKKLFVFINILGIGLAVSVCILAYLNQHFRDQWDSEQKNAESIKEIGIRKVLGASVPNLVGVISFEFIIILLVASLLGGFTGYVMVDFTMKAAWEYYEKVSALTLSTSLGIIILLSVLTVGLKIIRAAQLNPVKNLRSE